MPTAITYLIEPTAGGKFMLHCLGDLPAGTLLNGMDRLTVSGPDWDFAPKGAMTEIEINEWSAKLRAKGYVFESDGAFPPLPKSPDV